MTHCPLCQHPLKNAKLATCPICLAPLNTGEEADELPSSGASPLQDSPTSAIPFSPPPVASYPANSAVHKPANSSPGYAQPTGSHSPAPTPGYAPTVPGYSPTPYAGQSAHSVPGYAPPANAGQAPPLAPPAARMRVSLSGEVVQDEAPAPFAPPVGNYSPNAGGNSTYPSYSQTGGGPLPSSSPSISSSYDPPKPSRGFGGFGNSWKVGFGGAGLVIYLIFRVGLFALRMNHIQDRDSGGSRYGSHDGSKKGRSAFPWSKEENPFKASLNSPVSSARAAMEALHAQNWKKLYYVSEYENDELKTAETAGAFTEEIGAKVHEDSDPQSLFNIMRTAKDFEALPGGKAENKIDLQTLWHAPLNGKIVAFHGIAHMVQLKEGWQLDFTAADNHTYEDLLGKPESDGSQ